MKPKLLILSFSYKFNGSNLLDIDENESLSCSTNIENGIFLQRTSCA